MRLDGSVRALVTGASSGIGAAFARALAARGCPLVLVARSTGALEDLAAELRAAHGVAVDVLTADLGAAGEPERVAERAGRVDLLVNNAGFGTHAEVADEDPARVAEEVRVNCGAVVALTARLLPPMLGRGSGGVIDVASTAGFQPIAGMAVYAATKAFVLSFTEALWAETRGRGVRVLAVCPGPVETAFFRVAGGDDFLTRGRMTPQAVVTASLRRFERGGGPTFVPGARNRVLAGGYRFVPRAAIAAVSGRFVR